MLKGKHRIYLREYSIYSMHPDFRFIKGTEKNLTTELNYCEKAALYDYKKYE